VCDIGPCDGKNTRHILAFKQRQLAIEARRQITANAGDRFLDDIGVVEQPFRCRRYALAALLGEVYDLERLLSRLAYRSLGPRDCLALLRSLGGVELTRLPGLVDTGVNYLRTNIPLVDLPGYATTLMGMSDAQVGQMVVPEPYKNVNYNDMAVVIMEAPEAEISELHAFLLD